jgi:hypothetical protein
MPAPRSIACVAVLAFAALLGACGGGGGDGGGTVTPTPDFSTTPVTPGGGSSGTSAVALVDVNADGRLDLLATHEGSDQLTVQLGTGASFGAATTITVGDEPVALVTGDFDLDGDVDVAVAHDAGDSVRILLGQGNGTFVAGATVALAAGAGATAVVAGDWNGDGRIDLAVAAHDAASVAVIVGNGDGTFVAPASVSLGAGFEATGVVAADWNADGRLDLAVSGGADGSVAILLGQPGGTFAATTSVAVEAAAELSGVAAADLNGDGDLDLVVSNRTSGEVEVVLGNGDGTFGAVVDFAAGADAAAVAVADFDLDGALDVAVALGASGQVVVLYGDNTGMLAGSTTFSAGGTGSVDLAVGDADRNGSLDIAVANSVTGNVGVLFGVSHALPTISLLSPTTLAVGLGAETSDVLLVDLDGDGAVDVVTANRLTSTTSVMLGTGSGTFAAAANTSVGLALGPTDLAVGDLDRDGRLDVVTANSLGASLSLLLGSPLGLTLSGTVALEVGAEATGVALADFDHDGDLDVVAVNAGGTVAPAVALNLGNGTFAAASPIALPVGFQATAVAVGDFDHDADLDLAIAGEATGEVAVLLGNGAGGFGAATTFDVAAGADLSAVVTADMNRDGHLDLVVADESSGEVAVLLGTGLGTFGAAASFAAAGVTDVAVADFNRDGRLDVAAALGASGDAALLFGTGTGALGAATTFQGTGSGSVAVSVADVNDDGRLDVALANRTTGDVALFLGN